jgi:DNA-binding NarL/FixJ family response regulator
MHIRVGILENHTSITDGYRFRLAQDSEMDIVAAEKNWMDMQNLLEQDKVDVLISRVTIPLSQDNHNVISILSEIPKLKTKYPGIKILIISHMEQPLLINSLMEAGISGYIFKDDEDSIKNLPIIIRLIHLGGVYFSENIFKNAILLKTFQKLSSRQLEALSLCASNPDSDTVTLASQMGVSSSTLRNMLSSVYKKLGVQTRAAAILEAQNRGLIPPKM